MSKVSKNRLSTAELTNKNWGDGDLIVQGKHGHKGSRFHPRNFIATDFAFLPSQDSPMNLSLASARDAYDSGILATLILEAGCK
jgi:hypothetical protein